MDAGRGEGDGQPNEPHDGGDRLLRGVGILGPELAEEEDDPISRGFEVAAPLRQRGLHPDAEGPVVGRLPRRPVHFGMHQGSDWVTN